MIIWINGPCGVGKSTLAEALQQKLPNSFLFDAELVGDAIRENLPDQFRHETYEEFPLWHEMCCRLLKELSAIYSGHVFVPMTLKRPESHRAIIRHLRDAGVSVTHIMLEADPETVHDRILMRGEEENCWCIQQIPDCLDKQKAYPCDLRLCTQGKSPEELADAVIQALELTRCVL